MKYNIKSAFTFVELIVVVTIIAILATIGFTVYQRYLESTRDSNRVVQLKEISNGFDVLSLNARLPLPEDPILLESGSGITTTFAYQGTAGTAIMQAIGYTNGGKDPEYGIYPTYMLLENRKKYQLLAYVKDAKYLSSFYAYTEAAQMDYQKYFPKTEGNNLGILVDTNTQTPIQLLDVIQQAGKYNIMTGTGNFQAYFSDKKYVSSSETGALLAIIPNQSCNKILELGNSHGNGTYTISPDGVRKMQVYCDMTTDGGGWTMVARSVKNYVGSSSFGWLISRGSVADETSPYSFGSGVKDIYFTDILISGYESGKKPALGAWKLTDVDISQLKSETNTGAFNFGCENFITQSFTGCTSNTTGYKNWGYITDTTRYVFTWKSLGQGHLGYKTFTATNTGLNTTAGMIFIR